MNHRNDTSDQETDRSLKRVFDGAAPRPRASDAQRDEIFAAVHERWQGKVNRRRRARRWTAGGGLLAAGLVIAMVMNFSGRAPAPAPVVAQVAMLTGDVLVGHQDDPVWRPLAADEAGIARGMRLRTLDGALRVRTAGGGSLRIDAATVVEFDGPGDIVLPEGRIYYDSGARSAAIRIATALGTVRNQGTSFSVRADHDEVAVAVRAGATTLESRRGAPSITRAGQRQVFFASGEAPRIETIDASDASWAWADALAPRFSLDGRSALDYLNWVAQETGYTLRFASDKARLAARSKTFRGEGRASASVDTLEIALRSVGLRAEVHGSELIVSSL